MSAIGTTENGLPSLYPHFAPTFPFTSLLFLLVVAKNYFSGAGYSTIVPILFILVHFSIY